MRYVEAGGVRVSSIGLGCWQFGSRDWGYGKSYGDSTAVELVHWALDHDVNSSTRPRSTRGIRGDRRPGTGRSPGRGVPGHQGAPDLADRGASRNMAGSPRCGSGSRRSTSTRCTGRIRWSRSRRPWKGCAGCRRAGCPPRGGQQLLGRPVGCRRAELRCCQPGAVQPLQRKPDRERMRAGARPHRDRVQPARAGRPRRPYDGQPAAGPARLNNPLCLPENLERAGFHRCAAPAARNRHDAGAVALAWLIRKPNVIAIPGASSVDQLRRNVEAATSTSAKRRVTTEEATGSPR